MEKIATMPPLDLFGEEVVIRRRTFEPRKKTTPRLALLGLEQMAFLDILEMSDEELERQRQADEITDDYIDWLRGYVLKLTLRQLAHSQVSEQNRSDAYTWLMDDSVHPFSFRVCCEAFDSDYLEVREGVVSIIRRHKKP